MRRLPLLSTALLLVGICAAGQATAQENAPIWQPLPASGSQPAATQPAGLPREELEKLLGPIALYPDMLISQILPASTFPLDIVQAARWLRSKPDMSKLQDQPWDPSVLALCNYPDILYMMDKDLDWTNALGTAFLDQQEDVMNTIQDLRRKAQANGALKSTPEQTVSAEQGAVIIAPAQPEVIYVPQYNPQVVYAAPPVQTVVVKEDDSDEAWAAVAAGAVSFGVGMAMGAWLNTDCHWYGGHAGVVWRQPGHWHGYAHGGAVWGNDRIAAWGPNRAMVAGPNGGAYFGPRGAAAWGNGNAWARSSSYGRPSYSGRYASYNRGGTRANQVNRTSVRAGNTVNVNRNNVNIDRGNRTNIGGDRTGTGTGNRTGIGGENRAAAQAGGRGGGSNAFGGNARPSQAQQFSQRGGQSRSLANTPQPSRPNPPRTSAGGGSGRTSSFGDSGSRSQTRNYSSRGSSSRSGGGSVSRGGGRSGGGGISRGGGGGRSRGGGRR